MILMGHSSREFVDYPQEGLAGPLGVFIRNLARFERHNDGHGPFGRFARLHALSLAEIARAFKGGGSTSDSGKKEDLILKKIDHILVLLDIQATQLKKLEEQIMATQADLDAALVAIQTEIETVAKDVKDGIAALLAKIAAGATDLSAEVATLTTLQGKLGDIDAAAIAAKNS